ncbi:aldo/keto reductase [Thiocapsa rosea]|uniref:Diketogulonate reductase-like aldo/keto reductase n=1 Tax=Thiocapsa rosea TaxID=69360 RepID=A0A495VDD4_9GAMM|nr:aldo/keto reductase [Thiocapsa rosea]RKT46397.1 diketogulonate reductase-like aldo/keto reductase [Thiocapsa rosea]
MDRSCVSSRRAFLAALAVAPLSFLTLPGNSRAVDGQPYSKPIPSTGEPLPVVGMGTWITFNVGDDPVAQDVRTDVLRAFFDAGGGMIDSSPMYGTAEAVVGSCLARLDRPEGLFSATKVWTSSTAEGVEQIATSERLWGLPRLDLLQVHNLLNWSGHLETLSAMKADGEVRYIGITTSHGRRHAELAQIMETQPIDFVQLTYNIADREAETRLLPLAAERGIAVIANRPFQGGPLVDRVKRHPLPGWAREIDCTAWSQVLLKFIVSHPAVTCAIPATSRVDHMEENMAAARGAMPDAALRRRMAADVAAL